MVFLKYIQERYIACETRRVKSKTIPLVEWHVIEVNESKVELNICHSFKSFE